VFILGLFLGAFLLVENFPWLGEGCPGLLLINIFITITYYYEQD